MIAKLSLFYNAHTVKIKTPLCNILDRSDSRSRGAKTNYKYISTKNTAFGQSFFPKTRKDWNKLDDETKESSTTPVSGPYTANFTANPTTTIVSSYLTVTETYQPRQDEKATTLLRGVHVIPLSRDEHQSQNVLSYLKFQQCF